MTLRARNRIAVYAVLVADSCTRTGADPSKWRRGWELQDMEMVLLEHDPKLLTEMEDELSLDERRAVAKTVRAHSPTGPSPESAVRDEAGRIVAVRRLKTLFGGEQ
jgi:hypothetical protein